MGELEGLIEVLRSKYLDFKVDDYAYPLRITQLKEAGREYIVKGIFRGNDSFRGIVVDDGSPKMFFWTDSYPEYLKGVCVPREDYLEGQALETDRRNEYEAMRVNGLHGELEKNTEKIKEISIRPAKKAYDF